MRRYLTILLVAGVVVVLVACTSAVSTPTPDGGSEGTASPGASPTAGDDQSGFEDGDRITLVVPYSPGGGVDLNGRLIQPYLEEALREVTGKDVSIVVQNVEGASGRVGVDQVSRADPDGLTIGILIAQSMAGRQAVDDTPFDLAELTYIAQFYDGDRAFVVRQDLELSERTLNGLIERSQETPVLLGMGTPIDFLLMQAVLADAGSPFEVEIVEYPGASEGIIALLRGDVEAYWSTTAGMVELVEDNSAELEFLATTGCARTTLPDTETIVEQDVPEAEQICSSVGSSARMLFGPPGLPPGTTEALRQAAEIALNNVELVEEMRAAAFDVHYAPGEESHEAIRGMLETYATYRDVLEQE